MTPVLAVLPLLISAVISASIPQIRENKPSFPPTHGTTFHTHDPTVILSGDDYYSYSVGDHIRIYRSPSLSGPWEDVGSVLDSKSEIHKGNRQKPWAPSAIHHNGVYYCYYAVSEGGARNSAIGVATSLLPGPGLWKDHGLIVQSGKGNDANMTPFDISNTIDPDVSLEGGQPYLTFGSYWSGIWQVPLEWNMVSADYHNASQARHLAIDVKPSGLQHSTPAPLDSDPHGPHPIEGPFIGFHNGWYYLWFSSGQCCGFDPDSLPPPGDEYSIRVGRSRSARGPFVDREGKNLLHGGGELVYGSNRDVYAPGGQGVLREADGDILYYHYLNRTIGYDFHDALFGYIHLKYVDGWPIAV